MADTASIVHIGENSLENIAFKMMTLIAAVENRQAYGHGSTPMTREWIIKTYAQCRAIVSGFSDAETTIGFYNPGPAPASRG